MVTAQQNGCLSQNTVYIEGRSARINEKSQDQNPYNRDTDLVNHSIWNRGWFDQECGLK
jgi:hypothetical protein